MKMYECSKFEGCSAPLCPLDRELRKRTHIKGDRMCHYITMYSKPHEIGNIRHSLALELFKAIASAYPYISNYNTYTRDAVLKSALTPARGFK